MLFRGIADNTNPSSTSHALRHKRYNLFLEFIKGLGQSEVSILDVGGTEKYWFNMGLMNEDLNVSITLLNLEKEELSNSTFYAVQGNATDLSRYPDNSFDVIFSNSVIEHLFHWENQEKMAAEVQRVGKYHFIQTPNYWFPIEPHWFFPGFQFLPRTLKFHFTHKGNFGHIGNIPDPNKAIQKVDEIRLLSKKQFRTLFPASSIWEERFLGMTKSFVAHNFLT